MRQQIITQLKEKATLKHRDFIAKLTPGVSEILGVPMPEIRKIARGMEKESPRALFSMWEKEISFGVPLYMEEKILWGLMLGHCSMDFHYRVERISSFITAIDSWPVCDICKTDLDFLKNENESRMNLKRDANMRETIFLRVDANRQSVYVDDSFHQR